MPSHCSGQPLAECTRNVGTMVLNNRKAYTGRDAFAQREHGEYVFRDWDELSRDVLRFAAYLNRGPLRPGDRVALVTRNTYQRLVAELATMASGLISVPLFVGYTDDFISELLVFSEVAMLILDEPARLEQLATAGLEVVVLDAAVGGAEDGRTAAVSWSAVMAAGAAEDVARVSERFASVDPDALALIMYTSGTSSFPKGAMLTHRNIMSQQSALQMLWNPQPGMRFLCYLPWHHSFGGLFERFFALHSGGCLAVDDSWGKDTDSLFRNFERIRPHIYFSVPKVYQEIIARVLTDPRAGEIFFHDELKFVFTAAAPLPLSTSDVFKKMGVPVVEGWGLTETAPCCTLTDLSIDRQPGIVGFPLPGIELQLDEEGEILVRGPNVMQGYFKLPEVTAGVLERDGWFRTGDIGELTEGGLKICSRKDRIFKLSNGGKVNPTSIEEALRTRCKLIKHIYVFGSGLDQPCALLFPNTELFAQRAEGHLDDTACERPNCSATLAGCLQGCIRTINATVPIKSERIGKGVVVQRELSIENHELTPSFKLIPRRIEQRYAPFIQCLVNGTYDQMPEGGFLIDLGPPQP